MRLIAELGSNHNGDLKRATELVESAKAAGFTDIKTQAFHVERLFSPEALAARPELRDRPRLTFSTQWDLAALAHRLGMRFGVTPCSATDLSEVVGIVDWIKVGSYSLLDVPLLRVIATHKKPVLLSTGMATVGEIRDALRLLLGKNIALLHCVSDYPALPHEANLRSIPFLREEFKLPVGWSDHTVSSLVVGRAAVVYKASPIELHWDLDDGKGLEAGHSWTPKTWRAHLCAAATADDGYYACDGKVGVKQPSLSETYERDWRADPSDGLRPLKALRGSLRPHAVSQPEAGAPDGDVVPREGTSPEEGGVRVQPG